MAAETLADLEKKLAGYRESYRELEDALKADPGNEALISLKQEMHDVISMTEDMIKIKKAEQAAAASKVKETPETNGAGSAPQPPTQSELKVGSACWAQWSVDGLWYEAVIDEVKPNGDFLVTFVGYGNSEERSPNFVKPRSAQIDSKKRGAPMEAEKNTTIPKHLQILPTDTEQEREAKRKKLKQFTKAQNLKKKTEEKEKAVSAWQQFASKKNIGAKSIFRTPDNPLARVGVTGSGNPMTPFIDARQKWDKLKKPPSNSE